MRTLSFYAFIFLLGVAFAQAVYYFPVMPDPMTSHFGFYGQADGWMSKNGFFIFEAGLFLLMILSFIVMPWAFEKYRVRAGINMPNKDYWLAPERIEYFYSHFRESFCWFGVVTLVLLVGTMQMTFAANLQANPVLDMRKFLVLLGGYLLFTAIWTISFYRKFNKVE
ncbi:MAG: DUF1648 domain-containing protein [Aridibacter sp.]